MQFSATRFGRPGNLRFDIDVFAPEFTPHAMAGGSARSDALNQLDIHIETPFIGGSGPQRMRYHRNVGPEGNNVRLTSRSLIWWSVKPRRPPACTRFRSKAVAASSPSSTSTGAPLGPEPHKQST